MSSTRCEVIISLSLAAMHDAIGDDDPSEAMSRVACAAYGCAMFLKFTDFDMQGAAKYRTTIEVEAIEGDRVKIRMLFGASADARKKTMVSVKPLNWDLFVMNWNRICADIQGGATRTTAVGSECEWTMQMSSLKGSTSDIIYEYSGRAPLLWCL